jgi:hypothetical protein
MTTAPDAPQPCRPSPSAERMRVSRQRRRDGLRCVPLEVRDEEIEALVKAGLLASDARNDRTAIAAAMGRLLDRLPPERWTQLAYNPELVSLDLAPEFIDHLASLGWLSPTAARDNRALREGFVRFTDRANALSKGAPGLFRADR